MLYYRLDPTVNYKLPLDGTYTWTEIEQAYPNHHVIVNNRQVNHKGIETVTLLAVATTKHITDILNYFQNNESRYPCYSRHFIHNPLANNK